MQLVKLEVSGVYHDFGTGIKQIRIAERGVVIATKQGTMMNIQNFGVLFDKAHNVLNEHDEVLVTYCEHGRAPVVKKVTIMYFMSCFGFVQAMQNHLSKQQQSLELPKPVNCTCLNHRERMRQLSEKLARKRVITCN